MSSRTCDLDRGRQDQVLPAHRRDDPPGEALEAGGVLGARAGGHVGDGHRPAFGRCDPAGGPRGPGDLLRAETEREGRDRRVKAVGRIAVERIAPQLVALRDRGHRGVEHERRLAGPGRVPLAAADEDDHAGLLGEGAHRPRASLGQRFERADDEPGVAKPGLARRGCGHRTRVGVRSHAGQVELDRLPAGPIECRACQRSPGRPGTLTQVDQRDAGAQAPGHILDAAQVHDQGFREQRLDHRVRGVVAQEVRRHAVRHPQRPCERRAVRVLDDQQAARDQGRERAEAAPGGAGAGTDPRAAQLEGESDARAPSRDVVVEISVQALEPRVEVRCEGHQEQLQVDGLQAVRRDQLPEPDRDAAALGLGRLRIQLDQLRRGGEVGGLRDEALLRPRQQDVDLGLGDVQAAESVVGVRIRRAAAGHRCADARLDEAEPRLEIAQRCVPGRACRPSRDVGARAHDRR